MEAPSRTARQAGFEALRSKLISGKASSQTLQVYCRHSGPSKNPPSVVMSITGCKSLSKLVPRNPASTTREHDLETRLQLTKAQTSLSDSLTLPAPLNTSAKSLSYKTIRSKYSSVQRPTLQEQYRSDVCAKLSQRCPVGGCQTCHCAQEAKLPGSALGVDPNVSFLQLP